MKKREKWSPGLGGYWDGENHKPSRGSTLTIGRKNPRCNVKKIRRNTVLIRPGDEFKIRILNRVYIIRGTGSGGPGGVPGGLQIFGRDYLKDSVKTRPIYAGSTRGIVYGENFSIGYKEDIKNPDDIFPIVQLNRP